MKGFGRTFELNCLFLLVVTLLVALQLVLQRSHYQEILVQLKERGEEGEGEGEMEMEEGRQQRDVHPLAAPLHALNQDISPPNDAKALLKGGDGVGGGGSGGKNGDGVLAAPLVPNIRRSFPKRKAPYVRKGKKNKKKKKNRKGKQQKEMRGAGGEGGEGGKGNVRGGRGDNVANGKGQQKDNNNNKQRRGKIGDKS